MRFIAQIPSIPIFNACTLIIKLVRCVGHNARVLILKNPEKIGRSLIRKMRKPHSDEDVLTPHVGLLQQLQLSHGHSLARKGRR